MNTSNKPLHSIRSGAVRAAIWSNQGDSGTWSTVTLERSYRDQSGQWQSSSSFRRGDLANLASVALQAEAWLNAQAASPEEEAA